MATGSNIGRFTLISDIEILSGTDETCQVIYPLSVGTALVDWAQS